jgi:hypothetical protein
MSHDDVVLWVRENQPYGMDAVEWVDLLVRFGVELVQRASDQSGLSVQDVLSVGRRVS